MPSHPANTKRSPALFNAGCGFVRTVTAACTAAAMLAALAFTSACTRTEAPPWERDNPIKPLPKAPLGLQRQLSELAQPPTPERVRLGRWLFFDKRLSADNTVSCATCHVPKAAFSELTPVSTGINGQKGTRKAPTVINLAFSIAPNFFWDGRAGSLEEQAKGPIANPIEMGNSHVKAVATIAGIQGYGKYFKEAFGSKEVTIDRIAHAIADYERTRLSGNSPWDKWRAGDESAVNDQVKQGHALFFGKGLCVTCHIGTTFSDGQFHNLGVGYDPATKAFADVGRFAVTKKQADQGAFKTPTVRDVALHPPYMHDGSQATLQEVVAHYNQGGIANPQLSKRIPPLHLNQTEQDALVAFMEALTGEGYQDSGPARFPQ